MPKSSIARRRPLRVQLAQHRLEVASVSVIAACSVSSIMIRSGLERRTTRPSRSRGGSADGLPVRRRQVDRDVQVEVAVAPARAPRCRPRSSTHAVIGRIRPGALGERAGTRRAAAGRASGWFHRISASAPTMHACREVDDRLVVELELVAPLGAAAARAAIASSRLRVALRRLVEAVAVAAAVLGRVHGDVGVLEQRLGGVAVGREQAGADARR